MARRKRLVDVETTPPPAEVVVTRASVRAVIACQCALCREEIPEGSWCSVSDGYLVHLTCRPGVIPG